MATVWWERQGGGACPRNGRRAVSDHGAPRRAVKEAAITPAPRGRQPGLRLPCAGNGHLHLKVSQA